MAFEKFKSCVRYIHENLVPRGIVLTPDANLYTSAIKSDVHPMPAHMIERARGLKAHDIEFLFGSLRVPGAPRSRF